MTKKGPEKGGGKGEDEEKNSGEQDEYPIFHFLIAENPTIIFRDIIAKLTEHDKVRNFIFEFIAMRASVNSKEEVIAYIDGVLEAAEGLGAAPIEVIKIWEEVLDAIEDWWRRGEQSKVQKTADEVGGRIMINLSEIVARSRVFRREAREKTGMEPQPRKKSPYSIVMAFPDERGNDDTDPVN